MVSSQMSFPRADGHLGIFGHLHRLARAIFGVPLLRRTPLV